MGVLNGYSKGGVMAYNRFEQLDEIKKNTIIEAALDEFNEHSFKVASINKISKRAGLSAGALYYYIEDKTDLFYTILDVTIDKLWQVSGNLNSLFEEFGYWDGISTFVLKRFELSLSHPKYMKLINRILISEDDVELQGRKRLMVGFKEIFKYGYENGYIRKDLPKELLFNIHFNMTITINQWMIKEYSMISKDSANSEEVETILVNAVQLIKNALTKDVN